MPKGKQQRQQNDRRGSLTKRICDDPIARRERALARWAQWVLQRQDERDADSSSAPPVRSLVAQVWASDRSLAQAALAAERAVMADKFSMAPDANLLLDIGLRNTAVESLLLSLDSRFVNCAVSIIAESSHGQNECTGVGVRSALCWHVLGGKEAASLPNAHSTEREDALRNTERICLRRLLVLFKLLDRCGQLAADHTLPPLMPPHARRATCAEVLQDVLAPSLVGEGDVIRHLRMTASYELECCRAKETESGGPSGQLWSDMRNSLAGVLTDGVRLLKLVELLSGEHALGTYARRPAKNRADRLYNTEVALHAAAAAGMLSTTCTCERIELAAASVVDNHREGTVNIVAELFEDGHLASICPLSLLREQAEFGRLHEDRKTLCRKLVQGALKHLQSSRNRGKMEPLQIDGDDDNGNESKWADVRSVRQAFYSLAPSLEHRASVCITSSTDNTNDEDSRMVEALQAGLELPIILSSDSSGDSVAASALLSLAMPFIAYQRRLEIAAARIQYAWRKPRMVGHLQESKRSVRFIECLWKHRRKRRAALTLHRCARGMLARIEARKCRKRAIMLQAAARGWKVRRDASEGVTCARRKLYNALQRLAEISNEGEESLESIGDAAWRALRGGFGRDSSTTVESITRACNTIGRVSWLCPWTTRAQMASEGAPMQLLRVVRSVFPHIGDGEGAHELANSALHALGELAKDDAGAEAVVSEEERNSTLSETAHLYRDDVMVACAAMRVLENAAREASTAHAYRLSNTRATLVRLEQLMSAWLEPSNEQPDGVPQATSSGCSSNDADESKVNDVNSEKKHVPTEQQHFLFCGQWQASVLQSAQTALQAF